MIKRTPISYYGGKQGMSQHILPRIPPHRVYVEPFFGGGTIFWEKDLGYLEVINDTNDNLINFYQVLQKDFDKLNAEIQATLCSESLHKKAYSIYKNPKGHSKVIRAWALWYSTNFSFAAKIGGGWKFDAGTSNSHIGRQMNRRRNQFKYYKDRLATVQISCRDALTVIDNRDSDVTFFYLDPPYPGSDQGHYKGYTFDDLDNLLRKLIHLKGKFMLSNYHSEILDYFIDKYNWVTVDFDKRLSAPRVTAQRKTEVLVMNYNPENKLF